MNENNIKNDVKRGLLSFNEKTLRSGGLWIKFDFDEKLQKREPKPLIGAFESRLRKNEAITRHVFEKEFGSLKQTAVSYLPEFLFLFCQ